MKKILIFFILLLCAIIIGGLFLPREIHVERSIAINRPAATLFTLLNSYRSFNQWSPWAQRDPDASYEFSGPGEGVGARMSWSGDPAQVGTGWQEITVSIPYQKVGMHLDFGAQGIADSYFEIRGDTLGSSVTWGFDTDVTSDQGFFGALMGRYFGLFLDKWVGSDYEQGLEAFKQYAETLPAADFSNADIQLIDVEPAEILYVSGQTSREPDDIAAALASAYGEITAYLADNGIEMTGQPMAITRAWDETGYQFEAAIPVKNVTAPLAGNVMAGQSPAGRAVRMVHIGPYSQIQAGYEKMSAWMAANGLTEGSLSWEHYISDPGQTPEDEIITHIYFLVGEPD